MRSAYVISACRTGIGSFGGTLKDISAVKLGEIVVREAIRRANIKTQYIDEVILGTVLQAGLGLNAARQVSIYSDIPVEAPAYTVNKACGSGLKTVSLASQSIALSEADCAVAGGMESMSRTPYLLSEQRWGARMGDSQVVDVLLQDGLRDTFINDHIGITAENIAEQYDISRGEQDEFAYRSQCKAVEASREGRFSEEIVPITIPQRKGDPLVFCADEHIRENTTMEKLAMLKPAFTKEGTVTAGNASGINDGAACVMLASEEFIKEHGIKPLVKLVSRASAGVDPSVMGLGPIPSTKKALKLASLCMHDIDLVEVNEAFAAQTIAVLRDLEIEDSKVNVNGGAIALGHPVGASGARILVTLIQEMRRRNLEYGLATLCVGGGMGETVIVQRDTLCC